MIEARFNEVARDYENRFAIVDSAQIEPASPRDPQELYRMSYGTIRFDAVFYPSRVEIQEIGSERVVTEIPNDYSKQEVEMALEKAVRKL